MLNIFFRKEKRFFFSSSSSLVNLRKNVGICRSQLHRYLTFNIFGFGCIGSMRRTASTRISCSFYCLLLEENNQERSMDEKQQTSSSFYLLIDSILIEFLIRCQRILFIIIRNSRLKKNKQNLLYFAVLLLIRSYCPGICALLIVRLKQT